LTFVDNEILEGKDREKFLKAAVLALKAGYLCNVHVDLFLGGHGFGKICKYQIGNKLSGFPNP